MINRDLGGTRLAHVTQHNWQQPAPDLLEIIGDLWRHKWLIVLVALLVLAIAVPLILSREPVWRAEIKIAVDAPRQQLNALGAGRLEDSALETEIQVIRSRDLIEQIVVEEGLVALPAFNPKLRPPSMMDTFKDWLFVPLDAWLPAAEPSDAPTEEEIEASHYAGTIEYLLANLETSLVGRSQVVSVALTSSDRARVSEVVNAIGEAYIDEQTNRRRQLMAGIGAHFETQAQELATRVQDSEKALQQYRGESGLIQSGEMSISAQSLTDLTASLAEATAERIIAESKLVQFSQQSNPDQAALEILDMPHIGRMLEQEADLAAQEREYSSDLGERHPLMLQTRARLETVRSRVAAEIDRAEQSLRLAVLAARTRENELRAAIAEQQQNFAESSGEEANLRNLERIVEADRTLLENLEARSRELGAEAIFTQPNARIIAQAQPPLSSAEMSDAVLLGLTLPGSLAFGTMCAFGLVLLDRRPRKATEIEFGTNLPIVAAIPQISRRTPKSQFVNSMLDVYSNLVARSDGKLGTVLFTSSVPAEGKTNSAVTFARILARFGHTVLLIDGDLRRPCAHTHLNMSGHPGLSECLSYEVNVTDAVKYAQGGLAFLAAGASVVDVAKLSPDGEFHQLIEQCKSKFDAIVIDSAPVLAAAETRLLARLADHTVFLVRWHHTPLETVRRALRLLDEAGACITGITLSMVGDRDLADYGYSGRYARPAEPL